MKKLFFTLITLIASLKSFAVYNFTATNDYIQLASNTSGVVIQDVLRNDLDGYTGFGFDTFATPVNPASVTISVLSQSNPLVYLDGRKVVVGAGLPDGIYTIGYKMCKISNGQCSTTGTITVRIGGTPIAAPILSFTPQTACSGTNVTTVSGLPAGNWVINIERSGIWHKAISGSGTTYTTSTVQTNTDLSQGYEYRISVVNLANMSVSPFSPTVRLPEYTCYYNVLVTPTYVDYNNNSIMDIGDRVNYAFTVTNIAAPNFTINNVTLWTGPGIESGGQIIPTFPYNATSSALHGYHVITADDLITGSVFVKPAVSGTRGSSDFTQDVSITYHLPQTPPISAILGGGGSVCPDQPSNIQIGITGGTTPYTVVYSDGTNTFTQMGYISGESILVNAVGGTTYTLISVTDAWQNASASLSGTAVFTVGGNFSYYADLDGDGYGSGAPISSCDATVPAGYSSDNTDCNDNNTAISPGHAEVLYNGIDDNCNSQLDEGFQITTSLLPSICNTTLPALNTLIGITTLGPTSAYTRWRIKLTSGSQIQIIESNVPHFAITQLPTYAFATTYTVQIELQRNGIWLGYYGPTCQITTPSQINNQPASQISPAQCGATLSQINTLIATASLPNCTGYRFRVTNLTATPNANTVQQIDRAQNWFSLPMLTQYNYGTAYQIEVAVKIGTGTYGNFGTACQVTSPNAPSLINCSATIATMNTNIAANSVAGATQYRFEVRRLADNTTATIDRNTNYFKFNAVPAAAFTAGGLYSVRVSVMTTGAWSPFGNACQITAPGATVKHAEGSDDFSRYYTISAKVSPNPFTAGFSIVADLESQSNVEIKVYDMLGRLVETRDVAAADLSIQTIGAQYPTGVYNLILVQDNVAKTIRVVKR